MCIRDRQQHRADPAANQHAHNDAGTHANAHTNRNANTNLNPKRNAYTNPDPKRNAYTNPDAYDDTLADAYGDTAAVAPLPAADPAELKRQWVAGLAARPLNVYETRLQRKHRRQKLR